MLSGIYHNSRELKYRTPFGAVKTGAPMVIRIMSPNREVTVTLRLWVYGHEWLVAGERQGDMLAFTFNAPETPGLIWYYFLLETVHGRTYYSNNAGSGVGNIFGCPPPSYQITVYDAAFETPKWFCEGIIYQVFPDRFFRAKAVDTKAALAYHEKMGRTVVFHADWDEKPLFLALPGKRHYEPCDFYGGNLLGITQKLPYIKALGATCIYLNPIFEAASSHRYNTADYMKIDPVLGTEADFKQLVSEAARYSIKIMLDGVFSHTGSDSVYFDKGGTYAAMARRELPGAKKDRKPYAPGAYQSPESPYFDWYEFVNYPEAYKSWWGFLSLPEIKELTPSYMAFVADVIRKYAALGATSWRLDVADELPDAFIAFLRQTLKEEDPDGVLLGEVWDEASAKEGFGKRRQYTDGFLLDAVTGYPFKNTLFEFLLNRCSAQAFATQMTILMEKYPEPFYRANMNILGTHDTVRALTALCGAPHRDALTKAQQAAYKPSDEALELGKKRMKMAAMVLFTAVGVPSIYYGDEIGLQGMADPFNRGPYPWEQEENLDLLSLYTALTRLRNGSGVLKAGRAAYAALSSDVAAILRVEEAAGDCLLPQNCVITVINSANRDARVTISPDRFTEGIECDTLCLPGDLFDVFSGEQISAEDGAFYVSVPANEGRIFVSK